MDAVLEEKLRKSIKSKAVSLYIKDLIKSILIWGLGIPFFYMVTKDNKILSENAFALYVCYVILSVLPIVVFRLWRVFTFRAWQGQVFSVKMKTVRVPNKRRNVGVPNRMADFTLAPSCELTIKTQDGGRRMVEINGHLAGLAEGYLPKDAQAVFLYGARYPFNADCLPVRPYCLHCGYSGSPNEKNCTDCGCLMLPARIREAE